MTDHKESANSYLNASVYDTYEMTNADKVSLAQVHATLYLAEQQRVANLIAAYSSEAIRDELRDGNGDEPDKGRWAGGSIGIFAALVEDAVRGLDEGLGLT